MRSWIERAALALVPRDWRDAVARDLDEESALRPWRFAARAAAIGLRLQLARTRDLLTHPRTLRISFMRDFTRDLRFAIRGAVARPTYSLSVIATLAIGIGANAAIYSVFNWVLFRPIPGAAAPSELVTIRFQTDSREAMFWVSYRDYAILRDGTPALSALAASSPLALDLAVPGAVDPERIDAEMVTSNYFRMFGVTPAPGRDFLPEEERPGPNGPSVIISRRLWRDRFASSPSAIGQTLMLNGHAMTVAGVTPAGFQGRSLVTMTDVWVPIGAHPQVMPGASADLLGERGSTLFGDAFGRLRPGATPVLVQQQATAAADAATPGFARRRAKRTPRSIAPVVYDGVGQDTYAKDRLTTMFRLVMGAVGLLLLLACANAANLLLARSLGRRREIAVCQAIGASRLRVVRQQIVEGLVLSTAAGVAGLAIAVALTSLFDGMRLVTFIPAVTGVSLDARVVAFTMIMSLVTGVLFATAPAFASSRVDLTASLKDGLTVSRHGGRRLRATLAIVQVAVSILLVVSAGLFMRTLSKIRAIDLGIKPDGIVSFSANPTRQGYDADRARRYFHDTVERLSHTPGFRSVAYSWTTPYLPNRSDAGFTLPGAAVVHSAESNTVSRGFFATLGIPLVAGRDFTDLEAMMGGQEADVAIVSQRLAREVWPKGNAVGSRIVLDYPKGKVLEIVGVVGDVRGRPVTDEPEPWIYRPAGKPAWGIVHVRSDLPLAETAGVIRGVARGLDPNLPPYDLEPLAATVDRVLAEQRLLARLSAVFAAVAALLAAIGIYGMMACAVGERMREFGIRLALGARAPALLRLVLRSALTVTAAGLAAGVGAALLASRVLASRLYGVSGHDPAALAGACGLLVMLSVLASTLPALRATRADPVRSLRVD